MGYNILHTKNTKLCLRWKKLQVEQAQNPLKEDVCARTELTQENAAKEI